MIMMMDKSSGVTRGGPDGAQPHHRDFKPHHQDFKSHHWDFESDHRDFKHFLMFFELTKLLIIFEDDFSNFFFYRTHFSSQG